MQTEKTKGQRTFVPTTPNYHEKKYRSTWVSIGSAIILISIVVAIIVGFWLITF